MEVGSAAKYQEIFGVPVLQHRHRRDGGRRISANGRDEQLLFHRRRRTGGLGVPPRQMYSIGINLNPIRCS